MKSNRRSFIQMSLLAGTAAGITPAAGLLKEKAEKKLRILVLGGTGLIGPPMVEYAIARGHELTLFNRGKTNTQLFPGLEKLRGDRNDDLTSIAKEIGAGRRWDVIIDNTASVPRWVSSSASLLRDAADIYLYTSSVSAYADFKTPGITEDSSLAGVSAEEEARVKTPRDITGENYGGLKARCEEEAQKNFPDRCIIVRPTLIVGPGDYSDRFTYWPRRIARGGEVLCPGHPDDPVQFIDCRDLGEWYIRLVENRALGIYNGVGPRSPMSIAGMLYGMRAAFDREISFTWVDADFLSAHEVQAWGELTVWVPPEGEEGGLASVENTKAGKAGLSFRPLCETTRDTLDYWENLSDDRRKKPRAGLAPEKESRVLDAWRNRKS